MAYLQKKSRSSDSTQRAAGKVETIIISRLSSGLGNQLFQFACGLHLQNLHGGKLLFDTSWFTYFQRHQPRRNLRLDKIGLINSQFDVVTRPLGLLIGLATINHRMAKVLQTFLEAGKLTFINEGAAFQLEPVLHTSLPAGCVILNGYWQTCDHAAFAAPIIRERILKNWVFSPEAEIWNKKIHSSKSYFLHLRRGDYQQFGVPILPTEYYQKASEAALQVNPEAEFYIFTENVDWAGEILPFLPRAQVVCYKSSNRDIEDLLLMASCHGGVMANSTYSWWGAALGMPGRAIWAPNVWVEPGAPVPAALYPTEWKIVR